LTYDGKVNFTTNKRPCMRWDGFFPHTPLFTPADTNHNYCRNPDNDASGPWCYTTDPDVRWEYCAVGVPASPICFSELTLSPTPSPTTKAPTPWYATSSPTAPTFAPDMVEAEGCGLSENLLTYTGMVSVTASGRTCQTWSSQSPHVHGLAYYDHNYCRNPDNDLSGVWCFTNDPFMRWEYCRVGPPSSPWCTNADIIPPTTSPTPSPTTPAPTPPPTPCSFGARRTTETRIVGGGETDVREYPFQVSLQSGSFHFCGGSLVAPGWVLTAAHCGTIRNVEIGRHSLSADDECAERISVLRTIPHERYAKDGNNEYDIALLQLAENSAYPPIALSTGSEGSTGSIVTVSGWGTLETEGSSPDVLHAVDLVVKSNALCSRQYGSGQIFDSMMCAASPTGSGRDSCQGDSGGPLFVTNSGQDTQVGVVSFGIGCGLPSHSGVYTRVSSFLAWICEESGGAVCPERGS